MIIFNNNLKISGMDSSKNLQKSQSNQSMQNSQNGLNQSIQQSIVGTSNNIKDFNFNPDLGKSQVGLHGSTLGFSGINNDLVNSNSILNKSMNQSLIHSNFGEMIKSKQMLAFDFVSEFKSNLAEILEGNYNVFNGKLYKEIKRGEYLPLDIKFNSHKGLAEQKSEDQSLTSSTNLMKSSMSFTNKLEGFLNISNNEIYFLDAINQESFSNGKCGKEILEWIKKTIGNKTKEFIKDKKMDFIFTDINENREHILRCINLLENKKKNLEFQKLFQDVIQTMKYIEKEKDAEHYKNFFANQIFNKIFQKEFNLYSEKGINLDNLYFLNGDIKKSLNFDFQKPITHYDVFSLFTLTRVVEKCFNLVVFNDNYHKITNVDTFILLKPRRFLQFISKVCQISTNDDSKKISKKIQEYWNDIFIEKIDSDLKKEESFSKEFKKTNSIFLYAHNQLIANISHQYNKLYSFFKINSQSFNNYNFLNKFLTCFKNDELTKSMQSMSNSQTASKTLATSANLNTSAVLKSVKELVQSKSSRLPVFMDFINKISPIISSSFEEFQTLMEVIDMRIQDLYMNMLRFNLFMKNIHKIDLNWNVYKTFLESELKHAFNFSTNITKSKINNPESEVFTKTQEAFTKIIEQFKSQASEVFFNSQGNNDKSFEFIKSHYKGMDMILQTIGLDVLERNNENLDIRLKAIWPEGKKETSSPMQSIYVTNLLQKEATKEDHKLAYQKFFVSLFGSINKHNYIFAHEMLCSP